jgi:hypothetical protein
MNRTVISALVLAAAAGSALAETPTVVNENFVSTRTRADVQAELQAFKQSGVNPWSIQYNPLRTFKSATTREQVVAEYIASRDQVRAFSGEDSGSVHLAQGGSHATPSTTLAGQPRSAQ